MATTTLLSLLQAAAMMLTFAQTHPLPAATSQSVVHVASNAVQLVTQAAAPIDFAVPQSNSIWPNLDELAHAPYLDAPGHWVPLGSSVQLVQEDTSFGDLNGDGIDDAAVVVDRLSASGAPNYYLAAMLNQGGILFNIADVPLGPRLDIASHTVRGGEIFLDNNSYQLLGNVLLK